MRKATTLRNSTVALGGLSLVFALAACGGDDDDSASAGGSPTTGDCAAYEQYGDLSGTEVSLYTGITAPEDQPQIDSYKPFEECTGAKINYEGDKAFEAQILVRAKAGNPPDIGIIPQPGLLAQLVETGTVKEAPPGTVENVDKFWTPEWKEYGTVDGTFYAAPLGANVKSFVWYSPTAFSDNGWEIPTTLEELKALSDTIADTGIKPWCAGIGSGDATGWPITDWMEDFMLRTAGPEVYDQWYKHEIPFNSEAPTVALDAAGEYLKNDAYVNGGLGDVTSIANTAFADAGLPILDGTCAMHRQAGFYAANWPEGTTVAEDGDVWAFYLPTAEGDDTKPVLGGGEFIAAFADRPEVQAFQDYLSSDLWANNKADASPQGGWLSANNGLDIQKLAGPIDQLSAEILTDDAAIFRFDASDLMPGAVGANSFWHQATNWITGQSTKDTLDNIEASWPQ